MPSADRSKIAEQHMLVRPKFQLRSLPTKIRWEATRRHPYYQTLWRYARADYENEPTRDETDIIVRQGALLWLSAIGVTGNPPDPAIEFSQLYKEHLNAAWLSGAVEPITLRGLAGLLIAGLSKPTLQLIGTVLYQAGLEDLQGHQPRKAEAFDILSRATFADLDTFADLPIVSVNPAAAERQVMQSMRQLCKTWKNERNLSEKRNRSEKYSQYLRVWDMREGWTGSAYERSREQTFKQIAESTRKSIANAEEPILPCIRDYRWP